jgi:hypothetical protein
MIENYFLIGFSCGTVFGILFTLFYVYHQAAAMIENIGNNLETKLRERIIDVMVEQEQDMFYCYTKEDHEFVCQGTGVEEIQLNFNLKYPNKIINIVDGNEQAIKNLTATNV